MTIVDKPTSRRWDGAMMWALVSLDSDVTRKVRCRRDFLPHRLQRRSLLTSPSRLRSAGRKAHVEPSASRFPHRAVHTRSSRLDVHPYAPSVRNGPSYTVPAASNATRTAGAAARRCTGGERVIAICLADLPTPSKHLGHARWAAVSTGLEARSERSRFDQHLYTQAAQREYQ